MSFAMLVARQRSGTGALGSVLDGHADIAYLGEVFHPDNAGTDPNNYFAFLGQTASPADLIRPDKGLDLFNRYCAWLRERIAARVILLDVKYRSLHHVAESWRSPAEPPALLAHALHARWPMLHLTRHNTLETLVSGLLADANKVWHATSRDEVRITRVSVPIEAMMRTLRDTDLEVQLASRWLARTRRLETFDYADMFDDTGAIDETLAVRLTTLLDVAPLTKRQPSFVKQAPKRIADSIENFDAVREALAGTRFAWMAEGSRRPTRRTGSQVMMDDDADGTAAPPAVPAMGTGAAADDFIARRNAEALAEVGDFRETQAGRAPTLDASFHEAKNAFPYFGFVDVSAGPARLKLFSANDDLVAMKVFWFGERAGEEPALLHFLAAAAGARTIIDGGAFTGLYALAAARCAPKAIVHAVEPVRRTHGRLYTNASANGLLGRVTLHNVALAAAPGEAPIHRFRGDNVLANSASLITRRFTPTDSSERVRLITLDALVAELAAPPDLVKITTEGTEPAVLDGAAGTLAEHKPVVFVETAPETAQAVIGTLQRAGYAVHRAVSGSALAPCPSDSVTGLDLLCAVHPEGPAEVAATLAPAMQEKAS